SRHRARLPRRHPAQGRAQERALLLDVRAEVLLDAAQPRTARRCRGGDAGEGGGVRRQGRRAVRGRAGGPAGMSARVRVLGAGVAGLAAALELAQAGAEVEVLEVGKQPGGEAASRFAGGMLAPWCECVSAEPLVAELGRQALDWWPRQYPGTVRNGTLVLAAARDAGELEAFAQRSDNYRRLDADGVAALEPELAGRFRQGLFFADEAHLDPRAALAALVARLQPLGVAIHYGVDASKVPGDGR